MASARSVVVQADGGSRGNPGHAGYGAVVLDPDTGAVLAERWGYLGRTTNNVAEYSGVIAGLRAAAELGARRVAVRLDSNLIVQQMNGVWKVRKPELLPLADRVRDLVRGFDEVTFDWLPRERNKLADALANRAMDQGSAGGAPVEEPGAGPETGSADPATGSAGDPVSGSASAAPASARHPVSGSAGTVPASARHPVSGSAGTATGSARDPAAGEPLPHPAGATRIVIVRHGET
ncbi:MAG TPA: reverse transcriptase-like protein, partial [Nakamurella sp.]|nr:reverse transcriptase-like protein [Nakamurella sp.]